MAKIASDLPSPDWLPPSWLITKLETEEEAARFVTVYGRMGHDTKTAHAQSGGVLVAWSRQ